MGTRSDIIVHRKDGKYARVYCHWDGYLSHNGQILFEHYGTQAKAEKLVEPGDISSLAPSCNKPKGHTYDNAVKGYTVYYGRDRGEEGTEARVGNTLKDVSGDWNEYTYLFDKGQWWLIGYEPPTPEDHLYPLAQALQQEHT